MFTVVNSSRSEHGLGARDRWSRVGYRDYVRGVGNKVSSPSWVWRYIVQLGMCVGVDACKFK